MASAREFAPHTTSRHWGEAKVRGKKPKIYDMKLQTQNTSRTLIKATTPG
jgi:hypothetical protein